MPLASSAWTRDSDLRSALVQTLQSRPSCGRILHEFWVPVADERADVVEVNGVLSAYELKSGRDDLSRLDRQLAAFSRVFDEISVVCDPRHTAQVIKSAPEWCGIVEADSSLDSRVHLARLREARRSPVADLQLQLRLLWNEELAPLVGQLGIRTRGMRRPDLQAAVLRECTSSQVNELVRTRLATRDLSRRRL